MKLNELMNFINLEYENLIKKYPDLTDKERLLSHCAKLWEEYGEVCEKILCLLWTQRKDKFEKWVSKEDIGHEIVDLIFVALIISKSLNLDIQELISQNMDKVIKRRV